jgi:putative lipoic acid-binding regulatory protein
LQQVAIGAARPKIGRLEIIMTMTETTESLLKFPTDFPIKVMGRSKDGFAQLVFEIVRKHAPDYDGATMELRPSSAHNWLSVTCTIVARSREQLDALYSELSAHPDVAMVL